MDDFVRLYVVHVADMQEFLDPALSGVFLFTDRKSNGRVTAQG